MYLPIDYQKRLEKISELLANGVLLVLSNNESSRNRDTSYPFFRQDSFFYYLTGFEEPDAALLILSQRKKGERNFLFLRESDKNAELWTGKRLGVAAAKKSLPIDEALPIGELWSKLPDLLEGSDKVYFTLGKNELYDRQLIKALISYQRKQPRTKALGYHLPIFDADLLATKMRMVKEPAEIERMRRACLISQKGYEALFSKVRPGMTERQALGILIREYLDNDSEMEAFPAIMAGGSNACTLHYVENNMPLRDNDLLLVDSGAQFQYYAADVTRTFPIGKKFTSSQKQIYELILRAEEAAINSVRPGVNLFDIHNITATCLVDGLLSMNLLQGSRDEIIEKTLYKKYFPHSTSHWIGLDVHDVGAYQTGGTPIALEPNMYFSVEPGLYFNPSDETIPAEFRGIGIRIEDDVLVTDTGQEVLTCGIEKSVAGLENRF